MHRVCDTRMSCTLTHLSGTYYRVMSEKKRIAQVWIVGGFALVALGGIVNFAVLASNNYFGEGNVRADLQLFTVPISSIAALWAWWFLGKIATAESAHAPLFKKAFLGLSLQNIFLCLVFVNVLWCLRTFRTTRCTLASLPSSWSWGRLAPP